MVRKLLPSLAGLSVFRAFRGEAINKHPKTAISRVPVWVQKPSISAPDFAYHGLANESLQYQPTEAGALEPRAVGPWAMGLGLPTLRLR